MGLMESAHVTVRCGAMSPLIVRVPAGAGLLSIEYELTLAQLRLAGRLVIRVTTRPNSFITIDLSCLTEHLAPTLSLIIA